MKGDGKTGGIQPRTPYSRVNIISYEGTLSPIPYHPHGTLAHLGFVSKD